MKKADDGATRNATQATVWVPDISLGNRNSKKAMGIDIRRGEDLLGTLLIARGGIEFRKPRQKKDGRQIPWSEIVEMFSKRS
jgi:hypothetical protein